MKPSLGLHLMHSEFSLSAAVGERSLDSKQADCKYNPYVI